MCQSACKVLFHKTGDNGSLSTDDDHTSPLNLVSAAAAAGAMTAYCARSSKQLACRCQHSQSLCQGEEWVTCMLAKSPPTRAARCITMVGLTLSKRALADSYSARLASRLPAKVQCSPSGHSVAITSCIAIPTKPVPPVTRMISSCKGPILRSAACQVRSR